MNEAAFAKDFAADMVVITLLTEAEIIALGLNRRNKRHRWSSRDPFAHKMRSHEADKHIIPVFSKIQIC